MAKTKFRPLHDRVVVKRIDAEEKPAPPMPGGGGGMGGMGGMGF